MAQAMIPERIHAEILVSIITALQTHSPDLILMLKSSVIPLPFKQAGWVTSQLLKSISLQEPCLKALLWIVSKKKGKRGVSLEGIWPLPSSARLHLISYKQWRLHNTHSFRGCSYMTVFCFSEYWNRWQSCPKASALALPLLYPSPLHLKLLWVQDSHLCVCTDWAAGSGNKAQMNLLEEAAFQQNAIETTAALQRAFSLALCKT